MKLTLTTLTLLIAALFMSSCDESSNPDSGADDGYGMDFTGTLETYVDDVVLATYTDMKEKAWDLFDATETLTGNATQNNLEAVCAAWRATRIPWEQSEGFLYGPAALLSLDPSLDSWPLDKTQIDNILNTNAEITSDVIASSNVHGFHTIEYLIFEDGNPRAISELSDKQLEYLTVAVEYLRDDCLKLWSSWMGVEGISGRDLETLEDIEFEASYNFATQFKNAGKAGSSFISQDDAIDQIIDGCMDIVSEVGAQKIGGPNASGEVLDVESWYSWNSIDDYANNILSIRNSYFGGNGRTTASSNSLSAFVKSKDENLDNSVKAAIDDAYTAINNGMERPFRNNLTGAKVDAAINACADLEGILEEIKALKK
ncbi:MAG: hypothetical protein LC643_05135 [Bacteroidales bacterium]|nr:hypothetical protein [Bacteroidales bacterium]